MVKRGPRKTCESTTFGKRTKFSKGPPQNTQHWKSSESVTNGLLIRMQAQARNPQAKTKPNKPESVTDWSLIRAARSRRRCRGRRSAQWILECSECRFRGRHSTSLTSKGRCRFFAHTLSGFSSCLPLSHSGSVSHSATQPLRLSSCQQLSHSAT